MPISTFHRTEAPEIMDDFTMTGDILSDALDKIATINQLLGGNKITIDGIAKLLAQQEKSITYTIIDIGCGNGDMLRKIADFGLKNGYNFNLIGVDANLFTINYAKQLSNLYSNISYETINIFDNSFDKLKYDIALLTLTLHHFSNDEIHSLLDKINSKSSIGIVINDLQRSIVPYRLFQLLALVFNLNKMSKQDGLVSILRGFKKHDIIDFCQKLHFKKYTIQWKWAFRYQWIIWK